MDEMTPSAILAQMDGVRAETLRRLDSLSQEQLDWRPPVEAAGEAGWSLGEVFMHLAIDEHYVRENITRPLLEGIPPPAALSFLPPPPSYGTAKDVIQFWFARARLQTRRLLDDWPAAANLQLQHSGGLDAMNGAEWLLGYSGHEAFHHKQIDTLIGLLTVSQP
jgi:hypothetical protein